MPRNSDGEGTVAARAGPARSEEGGGDQGAGPHGRPPPRVIPPPAGRLSAAPAGDAPRPRVRKRWIASAATRWPSSLRWNRPEEVERGRAAPPGPLPAATNAGVRSTTGMPSRPPISARRREASSRSRSTPASRARRSRSAQSASSTCSAQGTTTNPSLAPEASTSSRSCAQEGGGEPPGVLDVGAAVAREDQLARLDPADGLLARRPEPAEGDLLPHVEPAVAVEPAGEGRGGLRFQPGDEAARRRRASK